MAVLSFLVFLLLLPSSYSCRYVRLAGRTASFPTAILNEDLGFKCYLLVWETAEISSMVWKQGNTVLVTANTEEKGKGSLTLHYVIKRSDLGKSFTCTISFVSSKCIVTVRIRTLYVPPGPPTITGPKEVKAGQTFEWTCTTEGSSGAVPYMEWNFGNQTAISLNLYNHADATTYENPANNLVAYRRSSVLKLAITEGINGFSLICKVIQHNSRRSAISAPYTVSMESTAGGAGSSEILALRQTTGTLPCKVDSAASVTKVRWLKNGKPLVTSTSRFGGSTTRKPSLTIWFMNKEDTGKYTCEVTQSGGKVTKTHTSLVVRYAPFITHTKNNKIQGRLGSTVVLDCMYAALPKPVGVYWFKIPVNRIQDEKFINALTKKSKYSGSTRDDPHLTIKKLTKDDAGWYRCKADNEIGRGEGPVVILTVT